VTLGYFYPVTKSNSMNRMNLPQLVSHFRSKNHEITADFFESFSDMEEVTVDGWIDEDFVKTHMGIQETEEGSMYWREIKANVTTAIGCYS